MKTYLRRLWAALAGREYVPLRMGERIVIASPGGHLFRMEVVEVTYHDEWGRAATLQITATTASHRLERQHG